jgi:hypothetical protein
MFGSIKKIITAIGGAAIAYKTLAKAGDFWAMGVKAARDIQEKLG